jgi:hypothetical protein
LRNIEQTIIGWKNSNEDVFVTPTSSPIVSPVSSRRSSVSSTAESVSSYATALSGTSFYTASSGVSDLFRDPVGETESAVDLPATITDRLQQLNTRPMLAGVRYLIGTLEAIMLSLDRQYRRVMDRAPAYDEPPPPYEELVDVLSTQPNPQHFAMTTIEMTEPDLPPLPAGAETLMNIVEWAGHATGVIQAVGSAAARGVGAVVPPVVNGAATVGGVAARQLYQGTLSGLAYAAGLIQRINQERARGAQINPERVQQIEQAVRVRQRRRNADAEIAAQTHLITSSRLRPRSKQV